MKKRVKIIKAPSGKPSVGDQMGYGLYRGQGVRDFESFPTGDPDSQIRTVYPQSPRSEANIEVEGGGKGKKGEKIIAKDGLSIFDIVGNRHSKGGVPVKAEPGSYVVSDFIKAPKSMQAEMGFNVKSNKGKDNTWARVLESKVPTKDYNRLSQILKDAAAGKPIDKFELATAKAKMGVYQDYVSKAALGNELTKAQQGKDFSIPQIGMPALQKMYPEIAERMMGEQDQESPSEDQQEMMEYGGSYYGLPKALEGQDIIPWLKGKTKAGSFTPTKLSNAFNRPDSYIQDWAQILGMNVDDLRAMDNKDVQSLIYDWSLQNNPDAINQMWRKYGLTNQGKKYKDLVALTQKNKKGNPLYTFGKDLSPTELAALKKAYTDNLFGARQLDIPREEPIIPIKPPSFTDDITPPEQEPETPTPPAQGMKWFCSPVTGQATPVPADLAGGSTTYYNTKEEAEAACGKKEQSNDGGKETKKEDPQFVKQQLNNIGLYPQDVFNTANALLNQYAYPTIGPFEGRYNPIYMDPAFTSTEAADRLIQSQGRTAMEDASLYGASPQAQNAKLAQINASVLPAMIQNRMQTNAQNVQTDMATRQFNAQVANQAALQDAARSTSLYDKTAKLAMNKAEEKVKGRTKTKDAINKTITNWGNAKLMSQLFPQYAFNPSTYDAFFKGGKGYNDDVSTYGRTAGMNNMSDYASLYKQGLAAARDQAGITDPKEAHEAAMKFISPYFRSTARNSDDDDASTFMNAAMRVSKDGGMFIPIYQLGGW